MSGQVGDRKDTGGISGFGEQQAATPVKAKKDKSFWSFLPTGTLLSLDKGKVPEQFLTQESCKNTFAKVMSTLNSAKELNSLSDDQLQALAEKCESYAASVKGNTEKEKEELKTTVAAIQNRVKSILTFSIKVEGKPWVPATQHQQKRIADTLETKQEQKPQLSIKPKSKEVREANYLKEGIPAGAFLSMGKVPNHLLTFDVLIKTLNNLERYVRKEGGNFTKQDVTQIFTVFQNFINKTPTSSDERKELEKKLLAFSSLLDIVEAAIDTKPPLKDANKAVAERPMSSQYLTVEAAIAARAAAKPPLKAADKAAAQRPLSNLHLAETVHDVIAHALEQKSMTTEELLDAVGDIQKWLKEHPAFCTDAQNSEDLEILRDICKDIRDTFEAESSEFKQCNDVSIFVDSLLTKLNPIDDVIKLAEKHLRQPTSKEEQAVQNSIKTLIEKHPDICKKNPEKMFALRSYMVDYTANSSDSTKWSPILDALEKLLPNMESDDD